ncbi:hypothetical protein CA606_01510 [Caulobacter vibrioides]|uniref:Periplasmic heavy metal sensor n=1 Tax=Caulobacter vibrioides TaxID=155892 RepID=A0A290MV64_CAUVI|nr:periplasmic heavy metal sensor [Caulobacter vibrioides]ATC31128.1 hypothetical protein CA606_01510 [Caulobacter vibrioides]
MSLSRPLLIGLIASATLNVFLIGGVAGVAFVRLTNPRVVAPEPSESDRTPLAPAPVAANPPAPIAAAAPPPAKSATDPSASQPRAKPAPQPASAAPPPGERLARPPLWTAGEQLSPQSRAALRQTLRAVNQKNQPITRQARAERRSALQALSTPGADPAEVARRLANARALDQEARANVESALAAFAATLSPTERAALAEGLRQVYAAPAQEEGGGRFRRQ